jgi:hypothetical protein
MDKNRFLIDLAESHRTDFGRVSFADQSEEQKVFSSIWVLESEVNNGGFIQYFENDRGETAYFAPNALKRIGAVKCAEIVECAIDVVCGASFSTDAKGIEAALAATSDDTEEELERLDSEFFNYPDNLTELLFVFVSNHPTVFGPIGTTN